ncbi:hypothetical protein JL722_12378 [Aureococcus anophagefferens]|nr:hypothetical protein JL722_12378 [Aureococcus anophagefferens]
MAAMRIVWSRVAAPLLRASPLLQSARARPLALLGARPLSSLPANLTLAEPAPTATTPTPPPPRINYALRGDEIHVDVEAFFGGGAAAPAIALPADVFAAPLGVGVLRDCVGGSATSGGRCTARRSAAARSPVDAEALPPEGHGQRARSLRSPLEGRRWRAGGDFKTELNKNSGASPSASPSRPSSASRLTVAASLDTPPKALASRAARGRGIRSALFVDDDLAEDFKTACRNVPLVDVLPQVGANVYSILQRDHLVLSESAVRAARAGERKGGAGYAHPRRRALAARLAP